MTDTEQTGTEHIVTVEATRVFRGDVGPAEAEFLTNDGERLDRLTGGTMDRCGVPMQFDEETKRTYECSCGRRFRKARTARKHLENNRPVDDEQAGQQPGDRDE